jgi:hypothetical protein
MSFNFNFKDFKYLQKLRAKYAGNENAYDAILYHMLTTSESDIDIPKKLKRAMEFYATPAGEKVYSQILSGKVDGNREGDREEDREGDIYDYSNDLAKAAQRERNFRKDVVSPEILAAEALQRFNNSI